MKANERHGGDVLVESMIQYGVDHIFGVPGAQILAIYDAVRKNSGEIRHIIMRDECNAAYAADAYARVTGKVGVCDGTVGCGAIKFLSGFTEAYNASIPVVGISGEGPSGWMTERFRGTGSQMSETKTALREVTKWGMKLTETARLPELINRAFQMATSNRPGPVIIELPQNLLEVPYPAPTPSVNPAFGRTPPMRFMPAPEDVRKAAELLAGAKNPLIVAGGGCWISGAGDALRALAEQFDAPVATSITGKGVLPEDHALSLGVIGGLGDTTVARAFSKEADLVLAVGTHFDQNTSYGFTFPRPEQTVIHIDADPSEMGKLTPLTMGLHGDARLTLEALAGTGLGRKNPAVYDRIAALRTEWKQRVREECTGGVITPPRLMQAINATAPDDCVLVCDAGPASPWGSRFFDVTGKRRALFPRGVAGLGFSIGAGIGAACGRPGSKVVVFGGDLGLSYALGELSTIQQYGLDITLVVNNNACMSAIKWEQATRWDGTFYQSSLPNIRFDKLGEAFACPGFHVDREADLEETLRKAMAVKGLSIVNVETSDDGRNIGIVGFEAMEEAQRMMAETEGVSFFE